jgi:hypothetical protein
MFCVLLIDCWGLVCAERWQTMPVVIAVTVMEAKGLLAMDHSGLADPFCVLRCGRDKQKTGVRTTCTFSCVMY